jgi:hypothetical protein
MSGMALAALLVVPAALAQPPAATAPLAASSVLPPPGIDDPGAKPQAVPLPKTGIPPSLAPAARQAAGQGDSTNVHPQVDASGDVVQETGRPGNTQTVRVVPKYGVPQTYRRGNADGSLTRDPRLGPVSPVYYDIYDWGQPPKPTSGRSG